MRRGLEFLNEINGNRYNLIETVKVIIYSLYTACFPCLSGVDPELAVPAFNRIDYDHDGTLAKDEFLCAVMSYYCDMSPSDVELMDSQFLG